MIQNSFIDMESMFKLFEEEEEVRPESIALRWLNYTGVMYLRLPESLWWWLIVYCVSACAFDFP